MFDTQIDLDQYRSVEELQRLANDVQDEMVAMERESDGRPYGDDARAKFVGLTKTKKELGKRIAELRGRQAAVAGYAANRSRVESVEDAYYPPSRPGTDRRLDEPRHLAEGREAGLRAIDAQAGILSARAGDRLEQAVRSDRSGVGGQYLEAIANPAYNSAFGKMLADPHSGHLRFTPAEVEAVRVATAVDAQRNLNVTTGSAGQFAIPFALDPSIIMTNTGVLNPLRDVCRVESIVGATTWKGVASDGVVAAFGAESAVATDASPTLVQPTIITQKAFVFVPYTIEASEDWDGLQKLAWGDVDETSSRFLIRSGKTATARRWVAVPEWLMLEIAATVPREDRTAERVVFPGFTGSAAKNAMARACKAVGIVHRHPHDLRHRYASVKIAEGVPVTTVAAQLGHSKKSLTLDVYSHVLLAEAG